MDGKWRETFLLHSQTDEFQAKVESSHKIISEALRRYKKPYVAFSGGKDSTVMMHLVIQHCPTIMVVHWDFGRWYVPQAVLDEISVLASSMGIVLRIESDTRYQQLKRTANNLPNLSILEERLMPEGVDSVFVGIRKEEACGRKQRIKAGISLTNIKEFWPVADWSWLDIWGYIVAYNVRYLAHYDTYCPVVGWDRARFHTFFDPALDKFGASNVDGVLMWRFKNPL